MPVNKTTAPSAGDPQVAAAATAPVNKTAKQSTDEDPTVTVIKNILRSAVSDRCGMSSFRQRWAETVIFETVCVVSEHKRRMIQDRRTGWIPQEQVGVKQHFHTEYIFIA